MAEYNPVVPINVNSQDNTVSIGVKNQGTVPAGVGGVKRVPMSVSAKHVDIGVAVNNTGMVSVDLQGGGQLPSDDYRTLRNKPSLNGVTLIENKDFDDVGLHTLSAMEILHILT